jgi:hypothetical protein
MEMFLFLLGLIFGGMVSWEFTHAYHKESSKDQNTVFKKLPVEVRQAIIEDDREKLSATELKELITKNTVENNDGESI